MMDRGISSSCETVKNGPPSCPKLVPGGRGPPLRYHIVVTVSSVEPWIVPPMASVIFSSCVKGTSPGSPTKLTSADERM